MAWQRALKGETAEYECEFRAHRLDGDWKWLHARGRTGTEHLEGLITPDTLSFICGPPAMVTELPRTLVSLGLSRDRIRTEHW